MFEKCRRTNNNNNNNDSGSSRNCIKMVRALLINLCNTRCCVCSLRERYFLCPHTSKKTQPRTNLHIQVHRHIHHRNMALQHVRPGQSESTSIGFPLEINRMPIACEFNCSHRQYFPHLICCCSSWHLATWCAGNLSIHPHAVRLLKNNSCTKSSCNFCTPLLLDPSLEAVYCFLLRSLWFPRLITEADVVLLTDK